MCRPLGSRSIPQVGDDRYSGLQVFGVWIVHPRRVSTVFLPFGPEGLPEGPFETAVFEIGNGIPAIQIPARYPARDLETAQAVHELATRTHVPWLQRRLLRLEAR